MYTLNQVTDSIADINSSESFTLSLAAMIFNAFAVSRRLLMVHLPWLL